ncbi:hypothetical protein V1525DRAFT_391724 [Lipomyces kononenkoae]|uniref:Uncharacterized protein n=1 Tax=Lipomyces kononenkoae TaxID=34357 RepID=A0ACC3SRE3_LIPKO
MDIDQILNSSTAQSQDHNPGPPPAPPPPPPPPEPGLDNVSSARAIKLSPESQVQRHPEKESSPTSASQHVSLPPPLEESKSTAPAASDIPQSWPLGETAPLLQQSVVPQYSPSPQQYHHGPQHSYAYPPQYHHQRYAQYPPPLYYQEQTTPYHISTPQHHMQPFQRDQYPSTVEQQFSFPHANDRNYGQSSSVSQLPPPRQPLSSQSMPQDHFAPALDSSVSSNLTPAYDGVGLRRSNSDADPQEETSTTAVKPKRRKAPNSTWTLEEDRKLVDMVLQTLPRQDFSEYAQILNKRDGQTVRYRWKVLVRRAKGENEDGTLP